MLKRLFYCKPSLLILLLLVIIIPPVSLLMSSFLSAMTWRMLDGSEYYKIGHWVGGSLGLCVILMALVILRLTWNATRSTHLVVRFLALFVALVVLLFYAVLPGNYPPLQRAIDVFYGKVYYLEGVTAESFVRLKGRIDSAFFPPRKIFIQSGGGDAYAGLAIGYLIQKNNLDVHVVDVCSSSCANYLFPSGRRKILSQNAIVMYHGNSLQEKTLHVISELKRVEFDASRLPKDLDLGKKGYEGTMSLGSNGPHINKSATKEVLDYLGWPRDLPENKIFIEFQREEKAFYEKIGVDPKIGIYGQIGIYKEIYQSYEKFGFYYSVEDMEKMGIKNIRIDGGVWQPKFNPDYGSYYEVKLSQGI